MRVDLEVHSTAPRATVWDVLVDWERQADWMVDARAVRVVTPHRVGEGVTIVCPTLLLGITVDDVMRVTGWEEGRRLEVVHLGHVITGTGAFELADAADGGTDIRWWEEVTPPLGALGEWGADMVVAPLVRRLFGRSLRNLARAAEARARAGG